MKFLWVLLLSFFFLISCTSVRPINISPNELQKQLPVGHIIKSGDEVKLGTRDGKFHHFKVLSVSNNFIKGQSIEVPIKDIIHVNKVEFSKTKTIALVAGVVVLAITMKNMTDGIVDIIDNVIND